MEKIASIFCIGLLIFYLLLLIALVVTPLFKQRKLKPQTGKSGKGGYGGPHSGQMTGNEDEQPVPFARKEAAEVSQPKAGPSAQPTSTNALRWRFSAAWRRRNSPIPSLRPCRPSRRPGTALVLKSGTGINDICAI